MAWRVWRGWTASRKHSLKVSFQRDAVFGDDTIQDVSDRVGKRESLELRASRELRGHHECCDFQGCSGYRMRRAEVGERQWSRK